ncbi:unnamed protein product [Sphagnum troendelagicum]|uniref:Uncharacterized protein n=1 Tax=Sphagnum troendelagicum TaxID=128251 RepID=A0ABP0TIM8_9BRYO
MNAAGNLLPQTSQKKGCEFSSTSTTTGCRHWCNPSPCVTTNSSQCKATEINRFDQPLLQQHSKPIQYFSKFANYVEWNRPPPRIPSSLRALNSSQSYQPTFKQCRHPVLVPDTLQPTGVPSRESQSPWKPSIRKVSTACARGGSTSAISQSWKPSVKQGNSRCSSRDFSEVSWRPCIRCYNGVGAKPTPEIQYRSSIRCFNGLPNCETKQPDFRPHSRIHLNQETQEPVWHPHKGRGTVKPPDEWLPPFRVTTPQAELTNQVPSSQMSQPSSNVPKPLLNEDATLAPRSSGMQTPPSRHRNSTCQPNESLIPEDLSHAEDDKDILRAQEQSETLAERESGKLKLQEERQMEERWLKSYLRSEPKFKEEESGGGGIYQGEDRRRPSTCWN